MKDGAMASKTNKAKTRRKAAPEGRAAEAKAAAADLSAFDIEAPELPEAIRKAAFGSGGYPYDKAMKRKPYEKELEALQIELLKLQNWVKEEGERVVIVFEGRDGAGKGGTIHRFAQHMNPRNARIVALSKPSEAEKGQWYFQRYASHMPTRGEIVFFDRSWYNRAGVEPVMGFCTEEEHQRFLAEAPVFEGMLARDGIRVFKLFLTIGAEMQMKRLHARYHDPLKRWKLSPIDFKAIDRFDAYSTAFDAMLEKTDAKGAPWTVIRSNDKLRARLGAMRFVLGALPYADKNEAVLKEPDRRVVFGAKAYLERGGED
jgi:polyphosphate kinase 2